VDIQVGGAKNIIYAQMDRNSANRWMQRVIDSMKVDDTLTRKDHNLLKGKWNHMRD